MKALDRPGIPLSAGDWHDVPVGGQDSVPAASFDLALSDHDVFDNGILRIRVTSRPPGLALAGDVDKSTFPNLVKALEMITGGLAPVHVDFAEVTYCDVAGLRALVRLTEANGGARRVNLHGLPPHLKAVLHILDWDSTPGLALY